MIQVCSRCGTRWNVRDRQRQWCPRCRGALLPAHAAQPWSRPPSSSARGHHPQLPPGFRWIAVRPGAAPPPRRRRRPLGPTPRYAFIPRWGLVDPATQHAPVEVTPPRRGPSSRAVRAMFITTALALGLAALLHIARYALLIVNRTVLLHPFIAGAATWVPVVASVGAMLATVGWALVLTEWLIARRAAAFAYHYRPDPRPVWALRLGCLVPVVNWFWALAFVVELAAAENKQRRLGRLIWVWWVLFLLSTVVSVYASATSFPSGTQGIADNTLSFVVAYLTALAAVIAVARLVFAFEHAPVERPSRRWLVVADDKQTSESAGAVEREGREPAA